MADNERLARLETVLEHVHETTVLMRSELHEHMQKEEAKATEQDKRIDKIENEQAAVQTHFKWLHGIWVAVSATIVGWFHLAK